MLGDRGVGGAEGLGRDQSPRFASEESAKRVVTVSVGIMPTTA